MSAGHGGGRDYGGGEDAVAELLAPAGECCRCHRHAAERITVALNGGNSGPGWSHRACLPCARVYARHLLAPEWLREDLAALDAARATPVLRLIPPRPDERDER